MSKRRGIYLLDPAAWETIYGPPERRALAELLEIDAQCHTAGQAQSNPDLLASVEVIVSGWGCPRLDGPLLDAAANLQLVLYGAGSVSGVISEALFSRGVKVCSAYAANAQPVAEFTLAAILLGLKQTFNLARKAHNSAAMPPVGTMPGAYRSSVGLVSLGMIGRKVASLLRQFDLEVCAFDPMLPEQDARAAGVRLLPLDELFAHCDVISLHTPWLKETERMIQHRHFAAMKPYSTFINTARGAVVNQHDLLAVAATRPDVQYILDVTHPEPPPAGSPLYTMPNIFLTPHIAGSIGRECQRMGQMMIAELKRYLAGEPLLTLITPQIAANSIHRPG